MEKSRTSAFIARTSASAALSLAFVSLSALSLPASAANAHDAHHADAVVAADTPSPVAAMSEGVVKKVDKVAGKLTLSHGPLRNLDMPAMTMVFRVKEAVWLDQLTPGEKIRFVADTVDGALTVVSFEAAK